MPGTGYDDPPARTEADEIRCSIRGGPSPSTSAPRAPADIDSSGPWYTPSPAGAPG
ncbi:MAG: hypothetical protein ACRDRJ_45030 [Streptosporangiaceae bacterium]